MPGAGDGFVPLTEEALRLSISWHRAWRLMLTGQLTGRKEGSRWVVTTESVDRVLAANQGTAATPA
jgi:hypothetical protein